MIQIPGEKSSCFSEGLGEQRLWSEQSGTKLSCTHLLGSGQALCCHVHGEPVGPLVPRQSGLCPTQLFIDTPLCELRTPENPSAGCNSKVTDYSLLLVFADGFVPVPGSLLPPLTES